MGSICSTCAAGDGRFLQPDCAGAVCPRMSAALQCHIVLVAKGVSARFRMPVSHAINRVSCGLLKAPACAQGYGGWLCRRGWPDRRRPSSRAMRPSRKQQGQDAAYGGDQTNLGCWRRHQLWGECNPVLSAMDHCTSIALQCTVAGKLGNCCQVRPFQRSRVIATGPHVQ